MSKKIKCMADGGIVGSDGMTDAQRAKRNAALSSLGMSTAPAPVQPAQAAPLPQAPVQQPPVQAQDRPRGIFGIVGGRQQQIDKAAGYACGGKIKAHAQGGKISGPGTPTSDSIPAVVEDTGEQIRVANKERIVSQAQDQFLESVARQMGFDNLDSMLEAGTGKPVGPTIKDGKAAAEDGMSPEERDRRLESGNIAGQWIGRSSTPTIGASDQSGEYSNALKTAPSLSGYVNRGDPVKDVATGIANVFSDSAKAARGEDGTYNEIVAARKARESGQVLGSVPGAQATNPAASAATIPVGGIADIPIGQNYGNEGRSVPQRISKSNPGVVVDNENQFTQGGRTYTSAPTSQQGISRITATGANPLYTNIKPEDAVSGLSNQPAVQNAAQQQEGIARIERGSAVSGMNGKMAGGDATNVLEKLNRYAEMIDAMNPSGGSGGHVLGEVAPGMTQTDIDNAEKTARWRQDDLIGKLGRGHGSDAAIVAALVANARSNDVAGTNSAQLQSAKLQNQAARYGHDINAQRAAENNRVQMRGQDINALSDKAKLAMLERNDQRQMDKFNLDKRIAEGALADSEAQRTARNNLNAAIASGDPAAISKAHTMAVASGLKFDREDKGMKPIEIADPTDKAGMRKILVQPNADNTYTPMQARAQQQAPSYDAYAAQIRAKNKGITEEQIKAGYAQLFGGK